MPTLSALTVDELVRALRMALRPPTRGHAAGVVGVSASTVEKWERGVAEPRVSDLLLLSAAAGARVWVTPRGLDLELPDPGITRQPGSQKSARSTGTRRPNQR